MSKEGKVAQDHYPNAFTVESLDTQRTNVNKHKPKIECGFCGKIGHEEEQCYHKKNQANYTEVKNATKEEKLL